MTLSQRSCGSVVCIQIISLHSALTMTKTFHPIQPCCSGFQSRGLGGGGGGGVQRSHTKFFVKIANFISSRELRQLYKQDDLNTAFLPSFCPSSSSIMQSSPKEAPTPESQRSKKKITINTVTTQNKDNRRERSTRRVFPPPLSLSALQSFQVFQQLILHINNRKGKWLAFKSNPVLSTSCRCKEVKL